MAPNEHLLDNFSASKETRALSAQILRLAQAKTGPGSGRELRELKVGLPAAAILVACERLNNTEVNKKAAQGASCLKDREFKRVYDTVRTILDENERAKNVAHESLHEHYKPGINIDSLKEFIAEVDTEATLRSGHDSTSAFLTALEGNRSQGSAVHSPTKSSPMVKVSSPLKRSHVEAISTSAVLSEIDETEPEDTIPKGRFRPVYLEHRQWKTQDPLIASIWKRAEKQRVGQGGSSARAPKLAHDNRSAKRTASLI